MPDPDPMRLRYRELSANEKAQMERIKRTGLLLYDNISSLGNSRETSLAKTKVEEAVMWAVKHITQPIEGPIDPEGVGQYRS